MNGASVDFLSSVRQSGMECAGLSPRDLAP